MSKEQLEEVYQWQLKTFGYVKALPNVFHLEQEVLELQHDLTTNAKDRRLEFADCFILLYGAAVADGMSYEDISKAISEKLEINRKRTWGKPDERGVTNHIKEKEVVHE
jgi:Protein of unknown function (DUF550)